MRQQNADRAGDQVRDNDSISTRPGAAAPALMTATMNNGIQIPRSVNINHKVNGNSKQAVGNQSVLEGRKVRAIIARIPAGPAVTSNGVAVSSNLDNAFLQLVNGNNEVIHDALPLYLLDPKANGTGQVFLLESAVIDWTKSAIVFGTPAEAAANKDKEIPLLVIYE
ncbi:hypothetical protein GCM10023185_38280 [Hymenobacter saemangeumensis]|uniref:Head decoration protein n=1 Tax=Hymenobacter saemangeumensis TaxID=1084522 RepID=A0ABP8IQF6_9BACT